MYNGGIKSALRVNVSNILGWRTNRKIVVIESDDWGSVRMSSPENFERLKKAGISIEKSHYNLYDSLESNDDMSHLMELLCMHKDATGRHPVITGVNVVANPDFEKVKATGYKEYFYEPYIETCKHYTAHDKVHDLWKEGIANRLLIPVFHGREHLNVQRWLRALQRGNKSTLLAFDCGVTGIPRKGIGGEVVPGFQAAFDIDTVTDLEYQKSVLDTGLDLFERLYGYMAKYFVPTNGPFNNSLETVLNDQGVKYINTGKKQQEPLGNGRYRVNTRFLGDQNQFGQIYLTRNCFFEPAASGFECPTSKNWIDCCLKEIEIAFRWHKPATISSHRVNYIGYLHPENRSNTLKQFNELLTRMFKKWPDIEFMTSVELGDLIAQTK
ncbi:hypothetical protein [uncultured Parabacteroides sp.]|uniref:hypothetical protein n=1 Tax=uncultured Parabacteroides sp. TaxID=512312 RepID=UPI0025954DDA|nr:hypothetical protein [uncultured Parabacteroides sp.]